ncbi:F-box and leucine-rich repeat protein 13-like [Styela clava]|uniref:F-box/LRR-repeat protein 2-like n=1 Tax=Styela clava TaxID=7725 RepID=UPI00193AA6F6|nr:F-box/LRR-repeat protein 2-like [Styela clava]
MGDDCNLSSEIVSLIDSRCAEQPFVENVDWLSLPQEIWLNILKYLPQAELYFNVCKVCKRWNNLCRDTSLWRDIDFHKMHKDIQVMIEKHGDMAPSNVSNSDFETILRIFHSFVYSIKMSRFFNDCGLQDTTLQYLCMCTNLQELDIGFCDDVDLSTICKHCTNLQSLCLEGCSCIADDDFSEIFLLSKLKKLCVSYCVLLTNKFLLYLYHLPNLKELSCDGVMRTTESGLVNFIRHQPSMEKLILDGEEMTDDLVLFATSHLPGLIVFELSFCQSLSDISVYSFQGRYKLESLKFRKASNLTGASICKLFHSSSIFNIKSFTITECEYMDDDALISMSYSCPQLELLTIDWCWKITDKGMCGVVDNCKKLKRMSLIGLFGIEGDKWLNDLDKTLPRLEFLDLTDCNNMPDDCLVDLVCRKRNLEVYTYYHDRVLVPSVSPEPISSSMEEEFIEWVCPGERGAKVIF